VIALSFFRARHDRRPKFARATRATNQTQTISRYVERVRMARRYIQRARAAGWRGSIRRAVGVESC
jgi:hypothetical protein